MSDEVTVLELADPSRAPLEAFQPIDPTSEEQTWPTEEEMADADGQSLWFKDLFPKH